MIPYPTRKRRPPIALALLALLAVALGWCAWRGLRVWRDIERLRPQLVALRDYAAGAEPWTAARVSEGCARAGVLAGDLTLLDRDMRPLAPLLRLLGALPRIGPTLAAAPDLSEGGMAAGRATDALCAAARPALPLLDQARAGASRDALLAQLIGHARAGDALLAQAANDLALARAALERVDLDALGGGPLGDQVERLRRGRELLGGGAFVLGEGRRLLPLLSELAAIDGPRAFLLLLQNNTELRATGGFVGTVALLQLHAGRVESVQLEISSDLTAIAPPGSPLPFPLKQYLGIQILHLRNANWWPDFPLSARTIEALWALNERPPLDGVIALDLQALEAVMAVVGPLEVPGYGRVAPERLADELFTLYERGGQVPRDRGVLDGLLRALLARLPALDAQEAQRLALTTLAALDQRHIQLALHNAEAQALLAERGWDGGSRWRPVVGSQQSVVSSQHSPTTDYRLPTTDYRLPTTDDYLRVVDNDVAFSDGWQYVQQRITYEVWLEGAQAEEGAATPPLRPLSSTVTLDYWNSYDGWRQAQAGHQVYSRCQDLRRGLYIFLPGCTGSFVRVYRPTLASFSGASGLDEPPQTRGEGDWLAVTGGYVLLYPGERQRSSFSYQHLGAPSASSADSYTLLVQKQAGTLARPLRLVLHWGSAPPLVLDSDLLHDRQFTFGVREGQLSLIADCRLQIADCGWGEESVVGAHLLRRDAVPQVAEVVPTFEQFAAFDTGLEHWNAGKSTEALAAWGCGVQGSAFRVQEAESDRRENSAPNLQSPIPNPQSPCDLALGAAEALRWQEQPEEALRLASALAEAQAGAHAQALLGAVLAQLGRDAEAALAYQRSLELAGGNGAAQLGLATVLARGGRQQEAATLLWPALDEQLAAGRSGPALAMFALLAESTPDDWRVYARWGDLLAATQPPTANDIYTRGLKRLPQSGELLRRRGALLASMGRVEESIADLRAGIAAAPRDPQAYDALARVLVEPGRDPQAALQLFEQAVALDPRNLPRLLALAQGYERLGDPRGAAMWYTKALEVDPGSSDARAGLERVKGI